MYISSQFPKLWPYIIKSLNEKVSKKMIFTFGIFSLIHYPIIYLIGSPIGKPHWVEIFLRVSIILICIPLCFVYHWPKKFNSFIRVYWFFCITYSLPFFATYMFIDYKGLQPWSTKLTVALLWLVLVTSWGQFLLSILIGTFIAALLHYSLFNFSFYESHISYSDVLNSFWIVIVAGVFSLRQETLTQEKQKALKSMAAAIAHEMRTPLSSVTHMAIGLKKHMPALIRSQYFAEQAKQPVEIIPENQLELLQEITHDLQEVARSAFTVIDMLLMNLQETPAQSTFEDCSLARCIKTALREYSLTPKEKSLISVKIESDFYFRGNSHLFKHVIFNLLKNSLYYIKAARKGEIIIWIEKGETVNKLCFKDTGKGIPKEILPHIFDQFYSQTKYGAGIGLAFCQMVMRKMGGDIQCDSVAGEFTQFTLSFPAAR